MVRRALREKEFKFEPLSYPSAELFKVLDLAVGCIPITEDLKYEVTPKNSEDLLFLSVCV